MNKWNYIFPKDEEIIIWGAGKKGREWLQFLQNMDRSVKCIFDIKAQGNLSGVPICKPQTNTNANCVMLISPANGIDILFEQARRLGYQQIHVGKVLEYLSQPGQEINTEVSLRDLFIINFSDEENRRYDIIVRYLAIEEYYNKNNYGFELYKKMQSLRTKKSEYGELAAVQFRGLIESFEKNGYDSESRIDVLSNLRLLDGSHRMALGLYHNLKNIAIRILSQDEKVDFGLDWFKEVGFTDEEIDLIKNRGEQLFNDWKIVEFTGAFWGSTLPFVEEALKDLRQYGEVFNIKYHTYRREEYNNMIKAVYAIDDIAKWKINKKIDYLKDYSPEIVSFNIKLETKYRIKEMSHLPLSIIGEEIKKEIRSKYQFQVDNYYYDIILHIADNSYQSDYMKLVFSPGIDLNEILDKCNKFQYALLGLDVPYMPEDFPNDIPVSKDIDILVLPEDYEALINELKNISKQFKDYEIVVREKSESKILIRCEKYGRLILQFDVSCDIEGLNKNFLQCAIDERVRLKNYFVLNDFYEYLYRMTKFSKNKSKWWHYKYLYDKQQVYDEKRAQNYCNIKLEDLL